MTTRAPRSLLAPVLWALAASACTGSGNDSDTPGLPLQPGGYRVALDAERSGPGSFETSETPDGIHLTTGPSGIAWRPADTVSLGDFRAEASLTLMGAPMGYKEGYGVFVGGQDLEGAWASYLYFMVRATGHFMVKRRVGEATETLLDWTSHAAVQRVAADGENPVNALAVEVVGDDVRFLVNGTEVFLMPAAEAKPYGATGLRINHRLHVLLGLWSLGPPTVPAPPTSAP